jgi:hypothetical protein
MHWTLRHPADWIPVWGEDIIYRPPDGRPIRGGIVTRPNVEPGHHQIALGHRLIVADARDVFPGPGWKKEREQIALEETEAIVPEESVEAMEGW